jgi:hypothetical protein
VAGDGVARGDDGLGDKGGAGHYITLGGLSEISREA